MSVQVHLPALFADRVNGVSRLEVTAQTVEEALRVVASDHPELAALIVGRSGDINPLMVVFLNDQQLGREQLQTPVGTDDEIEIVPAIEGGS
jgi:sulfur carrier protein ThiS